MLTKLREFHQLRRFRGLGVEELDRYRFTQKSRDRLKLEETGVKFRTFFSEVR